MTNIIRFGSIVAIGIGLLLFLPPAHSAERESRILASDTPVKRFVSEEESQEFFKSVQEGEVVFTGKIRAIILSPVTLGNPPVRITRITFDEITPLKGDKPYENTFIYPKSPETLNYSRGMKVIVALKHANPPVNGLKITGIAEADAHNLALVEQATGSAHP